MRKVIPVLVLALALGALVALPAQAAPNVAAPVGVVVLSQGAQVSQINAQNGTSLYPGDTLSTDATGTLRARFGNSQLMLGPQSAVKIVQGKHGVKAVLTHGTVRFSAVGSSMDLQALVANVHPEDDAAGQLSIVSGSEFQIGSTKGNLDVDLQGDDPHTVAENTAYDVTLQPVANYSDPGNPDTVGGGRVKGLWILIALILLLTAAGLYIATLSTSKF